MQRRGLENIHCSLPPFAFKGLYYCDELAFYMFWSDMAMRQIRLCFFVITYVLFCLVLHYLVLSHVQILLLPFATSWSLVFMSRTFFFNNKKSANKFLLNTLDLRLTSDFSVFPPHAFFFWTRPSDYWSMIPCMDWNHTQKIFRLSCPLPKEVLLVVVSKLFLATSLLPSIQPFWLINSV